MARTHRSPSARSKYRLNSPRYHLKHLDRRSGTPTGSTRRRNPLVGNADKRRLRRAHDATKARDFLKTVPSFTDRRASHISNQTHHAIDLDSDEDEDETRFEDSFFHWEEESTLFSDLLDDSPSELTDQKVEALVNSLQTSLDADGKELKKEIADTLVPTVNRVKTLYKVLDEKVDRDYANGLLNFNNACKKMEAAAIKEQDELNYAYKTSQEKMVDLVEQLREAYAQREALWTDLETAVENLVSPTLLLLQGMPAKVERTISTLEKQALSLEKDGDELASAAEKKVKSLLTKFA